MWISPDSTCGVFFFPLAISPYYVAVINLSHEYSDVPSPMSPSNEALIM